MKDSALSKYRVPTTSQVAKIPAKDYYQMGYTDWAPIINRIPYERGLLAEIESKALEGNNVIIAGAHFSGKTTLLMQLAKKISSPNILYLNSITKNEAEFIIKRIGSKETWVLFNNCCSDIDAFIALARITNINLVGTADDYSLETVKHLLAANISYKLVDCTDIAQNEAINMYNNVPSGIKKPIFSYKHDENEKYTMFENAYTQQYISRIFSELKKNDYEVFMTVMAASYFSCNNSAISYQNIANLLNIPIYPDAVNAVERATNYLRTFDIDLSRDETQIQFYILRSKIFIQTAGMVLAEKFRNDYAKLVENVVTKVNPYTIFRYDNFRRKAFDSQLFKSLFTLERAVYLYDIQVYGCNDYLETANDWLTQMTKDDIPDSSKTKKLKEQLATLLSVL